jgi:hypothetical protein
MSQIRRINNTQSVSRIGHVVKVDPRQPDKFIYIEKDATSVLGIVAEAVPYKSPCNIITIGEARVFVVGNVRKGDIIRTQKTTDNISTGACCIASNSDAPYLKVGTALESGRGLIKCSLNFAYILGSSGNVGGVTVTDGTYTMGLGITTDGVIVVKDGVIISITEAT